MKLRCPRSRTGIGDAGGDIHCASKPVVAPADSGAGVYPDADTENMVARAVATDDPLGETGCSSSVARAEQERVTVRLGQGGVARQVGETKVWLALMT